jgi:hypothetical protein
MSVDGGSRITAVRSWLHIAGPQTFKSTDFISALIAAAIAFALALGSEAVRGNGLAFLGAVAAIGIALTAIVAGILAIVVALFDETYRLVLQATKGGWAGAIRPYKTVVVVSVLTTLLSIAGILFWGLLFSWIKAIFLGVAAGMAVWSLWGTVEVVGITAFHGEKRFQLLKTFDDARSLLAERRAQRRTG